MLTVQSLKSSYVRAIFRRMRERSKARVESFSTNINLLIFEFDDFMEELCNLYDDLAENRK